MSDDTMRRLLTIRRTSDEDHAFAVAEGFANWIEKARTDKAALRARVALLEGLLGRARKYIEFEDEGRTYGNHTEGCLRFGDPDGCTCGVDDFRGELAKALRKE
jgi:hypothetical protein